MRKIRGPQRGRFPPVVFLPGKRRSSSQSQVSFLSYPFRGGHLCEYPGPSQTSVDKDPQAYEKRYHDIIKGLVKHHYNNIAFSNRRTDYVRQIKALLEEKKVPYAIFINLLNHDVLAVLQKIEAYEQFLGWQQELRAVFPKGMSSKEIEN